MNEDGNNLNKFDYNFNIVANCPYKGKCISEGFKCGSCKRNENKDYYIPDYEQPIQPWWGQQPIYREPTYKVVCTNHQNMDDLILEDFNNHIVENKKDYFEKE